MVFLNNILLRTESIRIERPSGSTMWFMCVVNIHHRLHILFSSKKSCGFGQQNPNVFSLFPQKPHVGLDWLLCNARKRVFLCMPSRGEVYTINIVHCCRRISRREKILHGRERHLMFTIRWLNSIHTKRHC